MKSGVLWEKKDKHLKGEDDSEKLGSVWDHTAIDTQSRVVVSYICGKRKKDATIKLVDDFADRCNNRFPPSKIRTDKYAAYEDAILRTYGANVVSDDPAEDEKYIPHFGFVYTTVKKTRAKGCIVDIKREISIGNDYISYCKLNANDYLNGANTNYVERQNGTDRHLNSRKARKTCEFSKDIEYHKKSGWLTLTYYNFCWNHSALRIELEKGKYKQQCPAMAKGIINHIWSIRELATYQVVKWVDWFSSQ